MAIHTWTLTSGGNFGSPPGWSPTGVPGTGDTANITSALTGPYEVDVTDAEAVATINLGASNAELVIEGGTLTMTGTLSFTAGTLAVIAGGELSGATVNDTAGNSLVFTDGTLNNVTWFGSLDLTGVTQSSLLTLTGGLTVFSDASKSAGGTINITGPGADLQIASSMTLDGVAGGNLNINIGATGALSNFLAVYSSDVLTLGSLTSVNQTAAGSTVNFADVATGGAIVNQGTMSFISGAGSAANVTVSNFTNSGTVTLVGGGTSPINGEALTINPGTSFLDSATGVFNVSDFGVLNVEGPSGAVDFSGQANISSGSAMYFGVFGGPVTDGSGTGNVGLTGTSSLEVQFDYQGLTTFGDTTSTLKLDTPGNFTGKVAGFAAAPGNVTEDKVDLLKTTGVTGFAPYTGTALGGTLTVLDNSSTVAAINLVGDYRTTQFSFGSDGNGGIDIFIACFCRGTLILTDEREVAVEDLKIGDKVVTLCGEARAIRWIGRRAYDARFMAGNRSILPIRIEAAALADGVPARDLFVSPEHALYLDGLFLPARLLVNGATIRQADSVDRLEYFHIELDAHDIIFAEGAAAETFIAVAGRAIFHNSAEFAALYPDSGPADGQSYWALLEEGAAGLRGVRGALLARAAELGRVSGDPDLHLIVDGAIVPAQSVAGHTHRFTLPPDARLVTIASRSVVPVESEAASSDDRRLGVPLQRVVLTGAGLRIEIGPDCPALQDGFHRDEGTHRWTDGRGSLPPGLLAGLRDGVADEFTVEVEIAPIELHYPTDTPAAPATDDGSPHRRTASSRIIS